MCILWNANVHFVEHKCDQGNKVDHLSKKYEVKICIEVVIAVVEGIRLRVSATTFCKPGTYSMVI